MSSMAAKRISAATFDPEPPPAQDPAALTDWGPPIAGSDVSAVVLKGVPVRLFQAWEEHSDALLREYVLTAAGPEQPYSTADVARAREARMAVARHVARNSAGAEPASTVDVTLKLAPPVSATAFSMLQAVLEDAMAWAMRGEFLTLPSLPEVVALRNWVCEEIINQVAGARPAPWSGVTVDPSSDLPVPVWEGVADLPADRNWLVGDDHNRIIAASPGALRLLHWDEHELIGQRIIAVIPPALREAHVAAFTLATLSGEYRLLGKPLQLNAWTHDGQETPITLRLERYTDGGKTAYVAWLDSAETN